MSGPAHIDPALKERLTQEAAAAFCQAWGVEPQRLCEPRGRILYDSNMVEVSVEAHGWMDHFPFNPSATARALFSWTTGALILTESLIGHAGQKKR